MSTNSGIVPSEDLIARCSKFLDGSNNERFLAIEISSNLKLQIDDSFQLQTSSDLNSDLDSLSEYLSESSKCIYLLMKTGESSNSFVSYVPNEAPVRQKMLYASTKNTLLNAIGTNTISHILQANSSLELNAQGWKSQIDSDSSNVLSESELALQRVKGSELLTQMNKRALAQQSHSHLMLKLNDESLINILETSSHLENNSLLSLKIDNESLQLNQIQRDISLDQLINALSNINEGPSYHIYQINDVAYFIYTCPSGSKVKDRMIYASNKQALLRELESRWGWTFKSTFEVGDPHELELSEFNSTTPSSSTSTPTSKTNGQQLRFAKPRGPKRR